MLEKPSSLIDGKSGVPLHHQQKTSTIPTLPSKGTRVFPSLLTLKNGRSRRFSQVETHLLVGISRFRGVEATQFGFWKVHNSRSIAVLLTTQRRPSIEGRLCVKRFRNCRLNRAERPHQGYWRPGHYRRFGWCPHPYHQLCGHLRGLTGARERAQCLPLPCRP